MAPHSNGGHLFGHFPARRVGVCVPGVPCPVTNSFMVPGSVRPSVTRHMRKRDT